MKKCNIRGTSASTSIQVMRKQLLLNMKNSSIPDKEFLQNLGLFTNRHLLQKFILMNELYQKIVNVCGIIIEFGVRWGQNLAILSNLRGIWEPYNFNRKIVGFDTFKGFPSVDPKDGSAQFINQGAFSVSVDYELELEKILDYHETENPYSHIRKYEIVKGDATKTIDKYLKEYPETIIAFAYFDFDLYEPTKKCLKAIQNYITKGSVIAFDELNLHDFPGETLAFKEVIGLDKYKIRRSPLNPFVGYIIID